MTTIYLIFNFTQKTSDFVCDSQETIDDGVANNYTGNFVVGNQDTANTTLLTNQTNYFNEVKDNWIIHKSIINSDDSHTWENCNLDEEPENDDVQYNILNWPNGDWLVATGLSSAKEVLNESKQNSLTWARLDGYQILSEWPLRKPSTKGLKTL